MTDAEHPLVRRLAASRIPSLPAPRAAAIPTGLPDPSDEDDSGFAGLGRAANCPQETRADWLIRLASHLGDLATDNRGVPVERRQPQIELRIIDSIKTV